MRTADHLGERRSFPQTLRRYAPQSRSVPALHLVRLAALMERTGGRPDVTIALLDGPVHVSHPDLTTPHIREISGRGRGTCVQPGSAACMHGTFVAGVLAAKRGSAAPAICPDCTLLVRPIFSESVPVNGSLPGATPEQLATAIVEVVEAGAQLLNLSVGLGHPSAAGQRALQEALDYAAMRGAITVAAAGNQSSVGSSLITRHRGVIPVVACDLRGRPMNQTNLSRSIGRGGLSAPGDRITSLGADGQPTTLSGTSVAAPFVTGTIALLWSAFDGAPAAEVKRAVLQAPTSRRASLVPPVVDAWAAYQLMKTFHT